MSPTTHAVERETYMNEESGPLPRYTGPFEIGQIVAGTYRVQKVLGLGGMNVVYEAQDLTLARVVALKVPIFSVYAPALHREAQALAALRSDHFASIFTVAREGSVEMVVMERLYGETLEDQLDELRLAHHRMPLDEVLRILVAITSALATVHACGITHRDLKPANVILAGTRIVLVDLGLFVPEVLVSRENDVAGSIQYIAPEVLLQDVERGHGPQVDLYSLGIVAFELLTNVTPYTDESLERVMANHLCAPIPDVATHRPDVPAELAQLVSELLAKDPNARPEGAEPVLWRLRELESRLTRPSRPSLIPGAPPGERGERG